MKNYKIYLSLFFFTASISFCFSQDDANTSYAVGFKYYKTRDITREYLIYDDTVPRPLLIHFWYPSENNSAVNKLKFKQYIELIAIREDYAKDKETIENECYGFIDAYAGYAKSNLRIAVNTSTESILNSVVCASLDISQAKGKFPLIIYAPSNAKTPVQNHLLCEQLASRGFYVISVSSAGENSINRNDPGKSMEAQVTDMEFILDYIRKDIGLTYSDLGLMGYSTGGLACALFQMKHPEVKAVCSLDGSQEYSFYLYLSKLEGFNLNNASAPYLALVNKTIASVYPYYNSIISSDKLALRYPHLDHFGFVSFWSYFEQCEPDILSNNYTASYYSMSESVLNFFNATLKGNKNAVSNLRNNISRKNEYMIQDDLDYSHAAILLNNYLKDSIYSAIYTCELTKPEKDNKDNYTEEEIGLLGRMLLDYDIESSVKLFAYNTKQFPNSWHAYYDLGFSYQIKNEPYLAKEAYLKAHDLNPENQEIINIISELSNEGL